ncbi:MAG: hypothetical protein RR854_00190 [Muribaculaceae bacterium]
MKTAQEKIIRIYTPLFWSASIDMLGTQLDQSFKEDEEGDTAYVPNRRLTPSVIYPIIRVKDKDNIFRTGIANDLLSNMHWYNGESEILSGSDYAIDNSNTLKRGTLTIYRNTPSGYSQTLRFEAVIADTRRNENVKVSIGGILLSTTDVATDKYEVVANIAPSYLYDPTSDVDVLTVNASAFRGVKGITQLTYELRKIVNGIERAIIPSDYEITSISGAFVFNPKLIQSNQYVIIGNLSNKEVGRYLFSITRSYPVWEAKQSGASDMEPTQVRVSDSVTITSSTGVIANQDKFFSIQPHTVTRKKGDMNWGESSRIDINAFEAGFEDGGSIGIYFEINEIPCMTVAINENGLLLGDDGNKLII